MNTDINTTLRGIQAAARQTAAQRLRELRTNAGLTQQQLADQISVTKQAISEWERGNNGPSPQTRKTLADLYHLSPDELDDQLGYTTAGYSQPGYRPDQIDPNRLLQARQSLSLTQEEAARLAGVTSRTISTSENGSSVPTIDTLLKLAKAYDKPISWFMENDHHDEPHQPE